jgi:CheY-like chemotaxis protein
MLLTDVGMPQMTGVVLAERLLAQRPDLPVLFISGYTEHPSVAALHPLLERPQSALLHKPFAAHALAEQIRNQLDR